MSAMHITIQIGMKTICQKTVNLHICQSSELYSIRFLTQIYHNQNNSNEIERSCVFPNKNTSKKKIH